MGTGVSRVAFGITAVKTWLDCTLCPIKSRSSNILVYVDVSRGKLCLIPFWVHDFCSSMLAWNVVSLLACDDTSVGLSCVAWQAVEKTRKRTHLQYLSGRHFLFVWRFWVFIDGFAAEVPSVVRIGNINSCTYWTKHSQKNRDCTHPSVFGFEFIIFRRNHGAMCVLSLSCLVAAVFLLVPVKYVTPLKKLKRERKTEVNLKSC